MEEGETASPFTFLYTISEIVTSILPGNWIFSSYPASLDKYESPLKRIRELSVILTPPASVGPSPARVLSIMIVLPM